MGDGKRKDFIKDLVEKIIYQNSLSLKIGQMV